MKRIYVVLLTSVVMFLSPPLLSGQDTFFCGMPDDENSPSFIPDPACVNNASEANLELYKPTSDDPVKVIRIRLHIMQRTGPNPENFEEQNQDHTDYLHQIITEANTRYANITEP